MRRGGGRQSVEFVREENLGIVFQFGEYERSGAAAHQTGRIVDDGRPAERLRGVGKRRRRSGKTEGMHRIAHGPKFEQKRSKIRRAARSRDLIEIRAKMSPSSLMK